MIILPAIDLKDGKAVRLTKGVMESAKVYSDSPADLAQRFEEMGAKWLHIVDLNGAFAGEPRNLAQIEEIRKRCSLKIELGGGVRDEKTIKRYLELGVDRLILGSIAVRNPELVAEWAGKYPIAVGIDARDGKVAVEGWGEETSVPAEELARKFRGSGVEVLIVTDISRDGTLSGVNVEFVKRVAEAANLPAIASGGVASERDIELVAEAGLYGVIVGKAFYEGKVDLERLFKKYPQK
jgi:phosphoribosylformimino-5-aminoimidazole carboxamide ribotide isomerase